MITAKELYGTYPHQQMRMYLLHTFPLDTPRQTGVRLAALVKKFLRNRNAQHPFDNFIPRNVDEAFVWDETPEGWGFWHEVQEFRPARADVPNPVKAAKEAPRKKVGWWA